MLIKSFQRPARQQFEQQQRALLGGLLGLRADSPVTPGALAPVVGPLRAAVVSGHRGIQFTSGVWVTPERVAENRVKRPRQQHIRQLPVTVGARTALADDGAECFGYLADVVQCRQHNQRPSPGRRQGCKDPVAVNQALGAGSDIQHVPNGGVLCHRAAFARPVASERINVFGHGAIVSTIESSLSPPDADTFMTRPRLQVRKCSHISSLNCKRRQHVPLLTSVNFKDLIHDVYSALRVLLDGF